MLMQRVGQGVETDGRAHDSAPDDPAETRYVADTSKLLGEAYHNLGVIDARAGRYREGAGEFQQAARWNPKLAELDRNWGVAAFRAGLYQEAIGPLDRHQVARVLKHEELRAGDGLEHFLLVAHGADLVVAAEHQQRGNADVLEARAAVDPAAARSSCW